MSDTLDPRGFLPAAPILSWADEVDRIPLAILPCLGPRYDRNGFPTYPNRRDRP
jgi:hypothetical protein